jgi:hypothetical protein
MYTLRFGSVFHSTGVAAMDINGSFGRTSSRGPQKTHAANVGEEALHTGYRYGNFTLLYAPVT